MRRQYAYLLPLIMLAVLSACTGTRAAYKAAAGNPEAYAYVLTEHYAAVVREAADRKDSGALTGSALAAAQAADRKALPLIEKLGPLAKAYTATKSAQDQAALQAALNEAVLALNELIHAVKGAST